MNELIIQFIVINGLVDACRRLNEISLVIEDSVNVLI